MRPMTPENVEKAARDDPDARPMTPEEMATARRVPRIKTLRRTLGLRASPLATKSHSAPSATGNRAARGPTNPPAPISPSSRTTQMACAGHCRSGRNDVCEDRVKILIFAPFRKIMATLAGQRAQFTWALNQYNLAEDAETRIQFARRMAKYIASAPAYGFTVAQITQGQNYPTAEVEQYINDPTVLPSAASRKSRRCGR